MINLLLAKVFKYAYQRPEELKSKVSYEKDVKIGENLCRGTQKGKATGNGVGDPETSALGMNLPAAASHRAQQNEDLTSQRHVTGKRFR